jgi:hypothetical protein
MFKATVDFDSASGTVLLPIDPLDIVQPRTALLHGALRYDPKDELHVTLIGKKLADRLKALGVTGNVADVLARLPKHWRVQPLGRWYVLQEPQWVSPGGGDREGRASMIEMVQCMEGMRFFAELSRQAGQDISPPPFHVTRFFHADSMGIAVPDQETLERLGTLLQEQPI